MNRCYHQFQKALSLVSHCYQSYAYYARLSLLPKIRAALMILRVSCSLAASLLIALFSNVWPLQYPFSLLNLQCENSIPL
jgi:hypothetical protein